MPQDPSAQDQTVRMRGDAPTVRPGLDRPQAAPSAAPSPSSAGSSSGGRDSTRTSSAVEIHDTRPVTRDWLTGAPSTGAETPEPAAHAGTPAAVRAGDERPRGWAGDGNAPLGAVTDEGRRDEAAHPTDAVPGPGAGESPSTDGATDPASPHPGDGPPPGAGPPSGDGHGSWWRRRAILAPAVAIGVLTAAYGLDLFVSSGDIPRNTVVAGVEIGGLSLADAATALEQDLAPRVAADHVVVADDVEAVLAPAPAGIELDVDGTVEAAADQPLNPWTRLVTLFGERTVEPEITGDETSLAAQIETIAAQVDRAPVDATIELAGTTPTLVEPADGRTLDREGSAEAITEALASGGDPATPIELPVEVRPSRVDTEEAQRVLDEVVTPALAAPVTVSSPDGATSAEVPVDAIAAGLTFTPQDDGELAVGIDPTALRSALGNTLGAFGNPPEDARFEVSGDAVAVVPSVDGTGVDPALLSEQLLGVLSEPAPRTVTAELGPVPAEFTTQDAEALGIRQEISSFTTTFTNPASGTNIRVVAEEVDGALVLPGETFSLNTFTGPRGTAQGYVPSTVISGGELSMAVGGGISQFATTMFNAVFFAGLEDVYHKPHSFYISRYPAGREATVYEGAIDLVWRNDGDTGVFIDTEWVPGAITVTFYGTERYEIESVSSERTNYRAPAVIDRVDDGDCISQDGVPGFDITVTRVFRDLDTGAEIRRQNFRTSYAAEAVINCLPAPPPGEGGAAPASPSTPD